MPLAFDFLDGIRWGVIRFRLAKNLLDGRGCEAQQLSPCNDMVVLLVPHEPVDCRDVRLVGSLARRANPLAG